MAFDGIVLAAVTRQLRQTILGGRVDKVYQPTDRDVVLHIRGQGQTFRLLLSAHASFPRAHLLKQSAAPNPAVPPMFCMLLRKHAEGARIVDVRQVGAERILWIDFEHRDELGDIRRRRLITEIMGRHSNTILLDVTTGNIMDSVAHISRAVNRHREVLPGRLYVSPPDQQKRSPIERKIEDFVAVRQLESDTPLHEWLVRTYTGISPLLAREIAFRAGADQVEVSPLAEGNALFDTVEHVFANDELPSIVVRRDEGPVAFSAVQLAHLDPNVHLGAPLTNELVAINDISACVEQFYDERASREVVRQKAGDLKRLVDKEWQKTVNKLGKLREELAQAHDVNEWRIWGELLNTYGYMVEPGSKSVTVPNYYDEEMRELTIPLDPALGASKNAQAYFRRYNKGRSSIPALQEQILQAQSDALYLETFATQIEHADWADIKDIRDEWDASGFAKRRKRRITTGRQKKLKTKETPIKPERFVSSEGIEIYVGKNNKQNEYLTMKFAQKTDTWLHTKDIPGSHVLIRERNVSEQTLQDAALLAAWFSKARESSSVPVDYTLVRHVWKPNGARPGFVLYEHQRTIIVTPSRDEVERLRPAAK